MKTTKKTIDVVAAVHVKDNCVYCCKRASDATLANYWEFPGGKVESGETDEQALIREMQEECNVNIKVNELLDQTIYEYDTFIVNLKCYFIDVISGEIKSIIHDDECYKELHKLLDLNFAPADINAVNKLIKLSSH